MFDIVMPFVREHMVYLVEALDSIDMQYCQNVILIPAFSADFVDTAIIQEITNKYVKLKIIYEDGDKSPGLARNMGMAVATAPWIMFFDADDIDNGRLRVYSDFIKKNSALSLISSGWQMFGSDSRTIIPTTVSVDDSLLVNLLWFDQLFGTLAIKRDFLQVNHLSFDQTMARSEDWIFILDALVAANKSNNAIKIIEKPLYKYRRHKNSTTAETIIEDETSQGVQLRIDYIEKIFGKLTDGNKKTLIVGMIAHAPCHWPIKRKFKKYDVSKDDWLDIFCDHQTIMKKDQAKLLLANLTK